MGKLSKLKEVVTHPVATATTAAGTVAAILNLDVIVSVIQGLYYAAPTLFSGASILSFTLPTVYPSLEILKPVFLFVMAVTGPLYVIRLIDNSEDTFDRFL